MITADDLANRIEVLVLDRDWVSFAELAHIEGFTEKPGFSFELSTDKATRFLWAEMSEAASDAVALLLDNQRVTLAPASLFVYLADGCLINDKKWLPCSLRPPDKANLKTPNGWLFYKPVAARKSQRKTGR